MHRRRKCHRHIWLLSGTGEGPLLGRTLINQGWNLTVSVVSAQASLAYSELPLENLKIGALNGIDGINKVFQEANTLHGGFDWVIDATHPFAVLITADLKQVCHDIAQPLLRYERPFEKSSGGSFLKSPNDLSTINLKGKRILIALGSRLLNDAVNSAREAGAIVFARVLPTPEGFQAALQCGLREGHLALLRPFNQSSCGEIELALCKRWEIDGVVCRQSGGKTEKLWRELSKALKLNLWLLSRPTISSDLEIVNTFEEIVERIAING